MKNNKRYMLAGCAVLLALGFAIAIWPIFRQMLNFSNPMTKSYSFYVPVNHLNNVIEDLILSNPEYRPPSESEKIQQQTNSQERFFLLYLKETDFIYSFKTIEGTLSSVDQPSAKAVSRLILRGGRKNNPKNSPWEDICEFKSYWGLYPVATTDLIIPFENTFIAAITKKINN